MRRPAAEEEGGPAGRQQGREAAHGPGQGRGSEGAERSGNQRSSAAPARVPNPIDSGRRPPMLCVSPKRYPARSQLDPAPFLEYISIGPRLVLLSSSSYQLPAPFHTLLRLSCRPLWTRPPPIRKAVKAGAGRGKGARRRWWSKARSALQVRGRPRSGHRSGRHCHPHQRALARQLQQLLELEGLQLKSRHRRRPEAGGRFRLVTRKKVERTTNH